MTESFDERSTYERACVREVEKQARQSPLLAGDGTVEREVRLDGQYPDTSLVLDVEWRGERAPVEWRLWHEGNGDFEAPSPVGMRPPPEIVAPDIMVYLYELQ